MKDNSNCTAFYKNTISGATIQHRSNGYFFGKHLHTSMEIYLIQSGNCSMDIGNTTIHCSAGDFIMIFPNVVHSFYLTEDDLCSFCHIHFFTDLFTTILPTAGSSANLIHALMFASPSFYRQAADKETEELVSFIIQLYQSGNSTAATINVHLLSLLLRILSCFKEKPAADAPSKYQEKYVSSALSYIENNYMNKILLDDIAREVHISSRYLCNLFTQYMHISLGKYINIYRINKAIELMKNTSLTLTEISGKIALKDSQHFSKLFFDIIGMPPSSYRKMFLQKHK